ncbi:MAG: hypothetical protein ACYSTS_07305 [Planctomycetota bacterium]|jgi:hypothetical protein
MQVTKLIIDGHVHYYNCYDFEKFFDMALNNMDKMFSSIYPEDNYFQKVLLLTEGKDNDFFSQFKMNRTYCKKSKYRFDDTQEDGSIILTKEGEPLCCILAGRQIVTRENLEVLSISSRQKIEDGLPIMDVIERLIGRKEIAILAWGVGKWFFKRGKIINDIIEKYHSPYLFIGDNSTRPSFWPKPKLYYLAEKHNMKILRGTDPLPFTNEQNRVGTSGFIISGNFQQNKPAGSFRNILISSKSNINIYGYQDSVISFIRKRARNFFF